MSVKENFKSNPLLYYAFSICATWAGIGSLMNGVAMTQKLGVIPSLIWVLGNTVACILFGYLALRLPKVREVFCSRIMLWVCGIMCVFQSWLGMNGMQAVFSDTILGPDTGMYIAYAEAVIFLAILYRFGMIRNVLTDGFGCLRQFLHHQWRPQGQGYPRRRLRASRPLRRLSGLGADVWLPADAKCGRRAAGPDDY